jgi:hypothetical protein
VARNLAIAILVIVSLVLIAAAVVLWAQPPEEPEEPEDQLKGQTAVEEEEPARETDVAKTIAALKRILERDGGSPAKAVEPSFRRKPDPVLRRMRLFDPSWEEPASQTPAEALAILDSALKNPPVDGAAKEAVWYAQLNLSLSKSKDVTRVVTLLAEDKNQDPKLRAMLLAGFGRLPVADINRLRRLCTKTLNDRSAHLWLRQSAAITLETKRVATDATRALLEKTVFAAGEVHLVQSTCLRALAKTAAPDHLRELLLNDDLRGHDSYMVRAAVCGGLATFGVRTRATLLYLCTQMSDVDPEDKEYWLPNKAILSFWALTGRAPGIAPKHEPLFSNVPASSRSEVDLGAAMSWFVPDGVSTPMLDAVQEVTCKNIERVRAAREKGEEIPWIRNDECLKAAVEFARKELDAIEAEWETQAASLATKK